MCLQKKQADNLLNKWKFTLKKKKHTISKCMSGDFDVTCDR